MAIQSDGKIVLSGYATLAGRQKAIALARVTHAGINDPSFGSDSLTTTIIGATGDNVANAMAISPDGHILVGGYAPTGSGYAFKVARYTSGGILDSAFGSSGFTQTSVGAGNSFITGLELQSNGDIVAVGYAAGITNPSSFALVRYAPTGNVDNTFGTNGIAMTDFGTNTNDRAYAVAIQPSDASIIAVGESDDGTISTFALACYYQ